MIETDDIEYEYLIPVHYKCNQTKINQKKRKIIRPNFMKETHRNIYLSLIKNFNTFNWGKTQIKPQFRELNVVMVECNE